jgi:hypothetical protein
VKTALSRAMMAVACIGLWAGFQAMAQDAGQHPPPAPAAGQPAAPQNGAPVGNPQQADTAAPQAAADNESPLDNGLLPDALGVSGCSACGGGSGAPPDWYTVQGVRVISRNAPRRIAVTEQAPAGGAYSAKPDTTGNFQVENKVGTIYTDLLGTIRQSFNGPLEVLTTRQFGLGVAAGYDVTIGHYFCRDKNNNDHFVEFTFWGLNSWSKTKTLAGYVVPVYDQTVPYSQAQAILINEAQLIPTSTGNYQGSLRTTFPIAGSTEFPGATDEQKTLSLAFNYGTGETFEYRSTMNNFELNGRFSPRGEPDRLVLHPDGRWQRECQPGTYMSYLYGLRFMQIDETFTFHSVGVGPFGNDSTEAVQDAVGDFGAVTHNNLLGLQLGVEMTFRKCRWAWGVHAKAGPYINFCSQNTTIDASVIGGTPRPDFHRYLSASTYPASLIGEAGLQATYKFKPNLMGRAAYDFMWVSGLALAPEQLPQFVANPVNRVAPSGTVFSQGISLGLEWMW